MSLRSVPFLVSLLALAACAGEAEPLRAPEVRPLVEVAPRAIVLRYDDGLRLHHCSGDEGYIAYSWTFALGPPSIDMLDAVFDELFEEVRRGPGAGYDLVEVSLLKFTGCDARWPIIGTSTVEIAYEAVALSPEGVEVARWSGFGRAGPGDDLGESPGLGGDPEQSHLNALTRLAMRRAAADFVVGFETEPSVRAWIGS